MLTREHSQCCAWAVSYDPYWLVYLGFNNHNCMLVLLQKRHCTTLAIYYSISLTSQKLFSYSMLRIHIFSTNYTVAVNHQSSHYRKHEKLLVKMWAPLIKAKQMCHCASFQTHICLKFQAKNIVSSASAITKSWTEAIMSVIYSK